MSDTTVLNRMDAEDWSGPTGDKWLANLEQFEGMIVPVGAALRVMSFGELLEQANPAAREPVHEQLVELFQRYRTPGGIAMPATAFLVSARA